MHFWSFHHNVKKGLTGIPNRVNKESQWVSLRELVLKGARASRARPFAVAVNACVSVVLLDQNLDQKSDQALDQKIDIAKPGCFKKVHL